MPTYALLRLFACGARIKDTEIIKSVAINVSENSQNIPSPKALCHIIRLSENDILAIQKAFQESFESEDHLWLFGSRVDTQKKGGDIDLYIETALKNVEDIVAARAKFYTKMIMTIGDQKIDIVVRQKNSASKLIHEIAKKEGVKLL